MTVLRWTQITREEDYTMTVLMRVDTYNKGRRSYNDCLNEGGHR